MKICSVENCGKKVIAKGLCTKHYQRVQRGVPLLAPEYDKKGKTNPRWIGGVTKRSDGRHMVYVPHHPNAINGKYVLRYRLVMEEHLGRILDKSEVVHHINGDPSDDRLENLVVTNHRTHKNQFHPTPVLKRWSRKFDACISCGASSKIGQSKHVGNGHCRTCYEKNK